MEKTKKPTHPSAEDLSITLIRFFNLAFGRNVRGSREFIESVSTALWAGYYPDELRIAFWVARCSSGKASWLGEQLRGDMLPYIVLRHQGRLNNVTGKEAKRWLDDLLARAGEMNPVMVKALLEVLPEDVRASEGAMLSGMGVKIE